MKIKTAEATPLQLDQLVAQCEKADKHHIGHPAHFSPATNWHQGGPIIEREHIWLSETLDRDQWIAAITKGSPINGYGPTPLVAAMRCYVASKLGDEVEIPEGKLT